jgi:hypothetical protein
VIHRVAADGTAVIYDLFTAFGIIVEQGDIVRLPRTPECLGVSRPDV